MKQNEEEEGNPEILTFNYQRIRNEHLNKIAASEYPNSNIEKKWSTRNPKLYKNQVLSKLENNLTTDEEINRAPLKGIKENLRTKKWIQFIISVLKEILNEDPDFKQIRPPPQANSLMWLKLQYKI